MMKHQRDAFLSRQTCLTQCLERVLFEELKCLKMPTNWWYHRVSMILIYNYYIYDHPWGCSSLSGRLLTDLKKKMPTSVFLFFDFEILCVPRLFFYNNNTI